MTTSNTEPTLQGLSNDVQGLSNDVQGLYNDVQGLSNDVQGLSNDVEGLANKVDQINTDVAKILTDNEKFNDRFSNYQQATQWVVQLAFTLIASATLTVIITSVFRK